MDDRIQLGLDRWMQRATDDADLAEELLVLTASGDEAGIAHRFGRPLPLEGGVMQGMLGAGPGRVNLYTVRGAAQGLAMVLRKRREKRAVVIGWDSRVKSELFAREAARVLTGYGLFVWMMPDSAPAPLVSFAVRQLGGGAGVYITGDALPAMYNGLRVLGPDGGRLPPAEAEALARRAAAADLFDTSHLADFKEMAKVGIIRYVRPETLHAYLFSVLETATHASPRQGLRVVYSPLHGTGGGTVPQVLELAGFYEVWTVPRQAAPDGYFPTLHSPHPAAPGTLDAALELAREKKADVVLATDPACNRAGMAVRQGDEYRLLSGNETAALLLDFLCRMNARRENRPAHPVAVQVLGGTGLSQSLADTYGLELRRVPPDFRNVGTQVDRLAQRHQTGRLLLGFDDEGGCLAAPYIREADGVAACLLLCEMAREALQEGRPLTEALQDMEARYGYRADRRYRFCLPPEPAEHGAAQDFEAMLGPEPQDAYTGAVALPFVEAADAMTTLRRQPPAQLAGLAVEESIDHGRPARGSGPPVADLLEYRLAQGAALFVAPASAGALEMRIETRAPGPDTPETRAAAQRLNRLLAYAVWQLVEERTAALQPGPEERAGTVPQPEGGPSPAVPVGAVRQQGPSQVDF